MALETSKTRDADFRKRRVQRIKKIIVTTVIVLLVLPTILTIFLTIKVLGLQKQVDLLASQNGQKVSVESSGSDADTGGFDNASASSVSGSTTTGAATVANDVEEAKKVYLTFDDGPGTQTEKILDVLKKENVKATFFVTGKDDSYSKKIYKRIVDEGHTLGMHSYSHVYSDIYSSTKSFAKDLDKISNLLYRVTGVRSKFYRFPGGSSTSGSEIPIGEFVKILEDKNITYLDWNVISPDAVSTSVKKEKMISGILDAVSAYETSVVLLYDVADRPMTVKALPEIIEELKKEGYKLLPVDDKTTLIRHSN